MEAYFKRIHFRFRIGDIDITEDLDKILESTQNEGTIKTTEKAKDLMFTKSSAQIEINIEKKNILIDKKPIIFLDENNKLLFKAYKRTEPYFSNILKMIEPEYDFYLPTDEKLSFKDLIEKRNEITEIIIKLKIDEYKDIFKPLCKKLSKKGDFIDIKTNYFLPESSKSLFIDRNSDFKLCIDQRIDLINLMINFVQSKKYILKIYGADGIGKSISFLYFTTIESDYKFIYFNLKDIYKYNNNTYLYFKNAMMKYYSNYPNVIEDIDDKMKDNYFIYQWEIKDFETIYKDKIKNGNFWDMLESFCLFISNYGNSIVIIDQYKSEYGDIEILKQLLSTFKEKGTIKFIISSSLNDYSVKDDFIIDLMVIYKDKIRTKTSLENIENIKELKEEELENQVFKDFKIEENSKDINYNEDEFSRICEFNIEAQVESKEIDKDIQKEEQNDSNEKENKIIEKKRIEPNDIIYINNLISIKKIINEEDDELFMLFNYNPKSYTKYNLINNSNKAKKYLQESFLQARFGEISYNVKLFYDNLSKMKYKDNSSENLKGTFLLKLNEIIKNKKQLDLQELIQSLEVYPFKYLKIYIADSHSKNNIITLNDELINKKFTLDYSYEFIEFAFLKIVDMITHVRLIDMNDLSGSGFGSFLENKIKKKIEKENGFEIRYFWNFTSISNNDNKEKKDKYIYDYKNYKKIKIEYDDITKFKIKDHNKYYYIIPGSQTNRSLDSVIIQPNGKETFDMICFQATKFKIAIKEKNEYISDCFIAKSKFESNYGIKIKNVFFYFILSDEFSNHVITKNLEIKGIEYFYYSFKDETFKTENDIILIKNLNREKAKIKQKLEENEQLLFKGKLGLFNIMINYLQRKRKKEINFKITQYYFDKARKYLFNKTPKISLDDENKKKMEKIVKKNCSNFSSKSFTFIFIFTIKLNEYFHLKEKEELIGILINNNKKNEKVYHYLYKGRIYPNDYENIPLQEFYFNEQKENRIIALKEEEYLVSDVPDEYVGKCILLFKIYSLSEYK